MWPSIEINNVIFIWFHADHRDPSWYPELATEIATNQWVYQGRTEHFVNCHIQVTSLIGLHSSAHLVVVHFYRKSLRTEQTLHILAKFTQILLYLVLI